MTDPISRLASQMVGVACHTRDMGKPSRRPGRRNRPKPVRFVAAGSQLRVVVVTQPRRGSGAPVELSRDIAMVKAALLYADHVELVSPGAALIASAGSLTNATTAEALALFTSFDPQTRQHLGGANLPDEWPQLMQGVLMLDELPTDVVREMLGDEGTDETLESLRSQAAGLHRAAAEMRSIAANLVVNSGLPELDDPIRAGLVTVNTMDAAEGTSEAVLDAYVRHLKDVLRNPRVHAVFDDSTASLARSLVREQHVEPHRLSLMHARQAAVGGGLVARLPSFPDSDIRDVLALRSDLSAPLGRYRRAVTALAGKLQAQAYDEESAVEIDDLWRTDVAPTLDELRDGLLTHSFIKELGRQMAASPKAISLGVASSGALMMGMQPIAGIDAALEAVGGAAPAVAALLHDSLKAAANSKQARTDVRRHDLFYLHEVNQQLQRA